jgi:hypothetical protein
MVTNDVLKSIGIHKLPLMHTRENDADVELSHFAFGLYPTVDDTAKIVTLFQNEGQHDGIDLFLFQTLLKNSCSFLITATLVSKEISFSKTNSSKNIIL